MVSIDTVYQRVLAILNKENRGYLTPQEFNLMANQAQLEIFEQYFYDLNQFSRMGENDSEYANIIDNIEEKIDLFGQSVELEVIDNYAELPEDVYRIGTISNDSITFDYVTKKEKNNILRSPLINLNSSTSYKDSNGTEPVGIYCKTRNFINIYPTVDSVICDYIAKPSEVEWAYINSNNTALYNSTNSTDFELHESEEPSLVIKILTYAGISIKATEITQVAETKDTKITTEEKS